MENNQKANALSTGISEVALKLSIQIGRSLLTKCLKAPLYSDKTAILGKLYLLQGIKTEAN